MLAQIRSRRLIDLSGLVHNLNVVTVGIEYPGCVIVRMILELGRRCSFLPSACCNCSYKEGIHLRMAFGDKTEVNGIGIGPLLFEPEEEASVISEAFEVWVTILVQKICDPERLESLRVKRDRTPKITHGHDDVVEHRIPPCCSSRRSASNQAIRATSPNSSTAPNCFADSSPRLRRARDSLPHVGRETLIAQRSA